MLPDQNFRLTDAQMASFIAHGHVTVTPDLPREFHAEIFAKHEEVFEKEGNPGNNLLPRIPLVRQIFEDAAVVGALQSIVGDGPDRRIRSFGLFRDLIAPTWA